MKLPLSIFLVALAVAALAADKTEWPAGVVALNWGPVVEGTSLPSNSVVRVYTNSSCRLTATGEPGLALELPSGESVFLAGCEYRASKVRGTVEMATIPYIQVAVVPPKKGKETEKVKPGKTAPDRKPSSGSAI